MTPEPAGRTGPADDPGAGADPILAFGGVVWDRDRAGGTVVVVVHRPRYDDWSFPKGKAEPGEEPADTARREVKEETGLTCALGLALGEQRYQTAAGPKVVGYWAMQPLRRRHRPGDAEVDAVAWWTVDEARRALTHAQDRQLLERFVALHPHLHPTTDRRADGI